MYMVCERFFHTTSERAWQWLDAKPQTTANADKVKITKPAAVPN